jgi:hypothetical protein
VSEIKLRQVLCVSVEVNGCADTASGGVGGGQEERERVDVMGFVASAMSIFIQ